MVSFSNVQVSNEKQRADGRARTSYGRTIGRNRLDAESCSDLEEMPSKRDTLNTGAMPPAAPAKSRFRPHPGVKCRGRVNSPMQQIYMHLFLPASLQVISCPWRTMDSRKDEALTKYELHALETRPSPGLIPIF